MRARSFFIGLALVFLSASVSASEVPADPLFSKMVGLWFGRGERVQFSETGVPSRSVPVEVEVESVVEADRLISTNTYREGFPTDAGYREYERIYFIRPDAASSGETSRGYLLGGGRGEPIHGEPAPAGSRGTLVGNHLTVVQLVPGQPPIRVQGETDFVDSKTTVYRETITWGDRLLTRSEIRYVRAQPDQP